MRRRILLDALSPVSTGLLELRVAVHIL